MNSLWQRFIERLFPPVRDYRFSRSARRTMQAMARQTYPKEAFGVLRGDHEGGVLTVREVSFQPFVNTRSSADVIIDGFAVSDLVGTFHSHPGPDDRPSRADLRLFGEHPGLHCIVGYPYNRAAVYNHKGTFLERIRL